MDFNWPSYVYLKNIPDGQTNRQNKWTNGQLPNLYEDLSTKSKISVILTIVFRELTCQASSSTLSEPMRKTIKLDAVTSNLSLPAEPSHKTTDLVTSSSTSSTFEYDEEDEDDQMDYYTDYNNTQNVSLVHDKLIIDKIQTYHNQNISEILTHVQVNYSNEIPDSNGVDAADNQDVKTEDNLNDASLIEDIYESGNVKDQDASNTTENVKNTNFHLTEATIRKDNNTTKPIQNLTLKAKQTMNNGQKLHPNMVTSLLYLLVLLKINI